MPDSLYILKRQPLIDEWAEFGPDAIEGDQLNATQEDFNVLFRLLDIEATRQQVEILLESFYLSAWADGHCQEFSLKEKRIQETVDAVVSALLEEK